VTEPTQAGVRVAFELTWADVSLVVKHRLTRPGIMVCLVGLVSLSLYQAWLGVRDPADYFIAYVPVSVAVVLTAGSFLGIRQEFSAMGASERQLEYVFSEDGVVRRSGVAETDLGWHAFATWVETRKAILLYERPAVWKPIPKRALSSGADLDRLRQLLDVAAAPDQPAGDATADAGEPRTLSQPCPCCGGRMIIIETFEPGTTPRYRPMTPTIDTS